MSSFRERGGPWVVGQSILLLATLFSVAFDRSPTVSMGFRGVALGLFLLGALVGVAGTRALGRNRTAFPQPVASGGLVQTGIYSWVRHPLYGSVILLAFGWAAGWGSWAALLGALLLTIFLDAKARREERWLRARFPDYVGYCRRVRRLLPGIY